MGCENNIIKRPSANEIGTDQLILKKYNAQQREIQLRNFSPQPLPKVCRAIHDCQIGSYCERIEGSEHSVCLPLAQAKEHDWRYNPSHPESKNIEICKSSKDCQTAGKAECRGFKDVSETKICIPHALGLRNRQPIAFADTSNIS